MGPRISVRVSRDGEPSRSLRGFESVSISRSVKAFADSFDITYSQRASSLEEARVLRAGDRVTVSLGDNDILEGWVDVDSASFDTGSFTHRVRGRSLLGDLEDCSAFLSGRSHRMRDVTLLEVIEQLVSEYQIPIGSADTGELEKFESFVVKRGETVAQAVRRAGRLRGAWIVDDGGLLRVVRKTHERTGVRLRRGDLLKGTRTINHKGRYSAYRFRGPSSFRDVSSIRVVRGVEREVRSEDVSREVRNAREVAKEIADNRITRPRRLEVVSHGRRRRDIDKRALLERQQRSGESDKYTAELAGWESSSGDVWRPMSIVHLRDDRLDVNAELVISTVQLTYAAEPGRFRTTLTLVPPQTYDTIGDLS